MVLFRAWIWILAAPSHPFRSTKSRPLLDGKGKWRGRRGSGVDERDHSRSASCEVAGGDSHGDVGCVDDGSRAIAAVPESGNPGYKVRPCKRKESVPGAVYDAGEGA
jgi:hypothetical protein